MDGSTSKLRLKLKSPPITSKPSEKESSFSNISSRKGSCDELGACTFTKVHVCVPSIPFRKIVQPDESVQVSVVCQGTVLWIKMPTPLSIEGRHEKNVEILGFYRTELCQTQSVFPGASKHVPLANVIP